MMISPELPAAGFRWHKSSYSTGNGECVEVLRGKDAVGVRDSRLLDGPSLRYPAQTWRSFLDDAKLGRFDIRRKMLSFYSSTQGPLNSSGSLGRRTYAASGPLCYLRQAEAPALLILRTSDL